MYMKTLLILILHEYLIYIHVHEYLINLMYNEYLINLDVQVEWGVEDDDDRNKEPKTDQEDVVGDDVEVVQCTFRCSPSWSTTEQLYLLKGLLSKLEHNWTIIFTKGTALQAGTQLNNYIY